MGQNESLNRNSKVKWNFNNWLWKSMESSIKKTKNIKH